ncbi:MAG: LytR/AlgR family response regulator transcription factor [Myxococcota bacterium]
MRILIADDEQLARARLKRLLGAMEGVELVGEATDGHEVLARLKQGGVDVVLLDIQMPKLTGVEAMALWPADGPFVIFCTAHAEHAVEAFDSGVVDYLLKPIEPARLHKALERARQRESQTRFSTAVKQSQLARIAITTRQGVVLLDPASITHATLEDELVTVFTRDAQHLTDFTLQELHERLPQFERVHRRALLNLNAVARLEPLETGGYTARTHAGHAVEVSRQAARELRRRLGLRKAPGEDD